jgi:hypothetical protein
MDTMEKKEKKFINDYMWINILVFLDLKSRNNAFETSKYMRQFYFRIIPNIDDFKDVFPDLKINDDNELIKTFESDEKYNKYLEKINKRYMASYYGSKDDFSKHYDIHPKLNMKFPLIDKSYFNVNFNFAKYFSVQFGNKDGWDGMMAVFMESKTKDIQKVVEMTKFQCQFCREKFKGIEYSCLDSLGRCSCDITRVCKRCAIIHGDYHTFVPGDIYEYNDLNYLEWIRIAEYDMEESSTFWYINCNPDNKYYGKICIQGYQGEFMILTTLLSFLNNFPNRVKKIMSRYSDGKTTPDGEDFLSNC